MSNTPVPAAATGLPSATIPSSQILDRPLKRTSGERLADLHAEYLRIVAFYNACCDAENDAGKDGADEADRACKQAVRMLEECEGLIEALPSRTIADLGLKARVLSWSQAEWWDMRETDYPGARNLIDDVLSLADMDRIRRPDAPFDVFLPGYAGAPHHVAPVDKSVTVTDAADPILAAIEAHRLAYVALGDAHNFNHTADQQEAAARDDNDTFQALGRITPTTVAGLLALVDYVEVYAATDDDLALPTLFPAIARGCRLLLAGKGGVS